MKMKITLFGSFGLLLFLLSSCSNLIEKTDSAENNNFATLKICLNEDSRTVFPNTILDELTNIELRGLISDEDYYKNIEYESNGYSYGNYEKTLGTYSSLSDLQKAEIKLDTGEWSFTLTAKKGGTTYKAVKTQTIIEGENTLSFDLELYNSGNGKGAFSITLDFSEADNSDKVTSAKAVLQNMDGSSVSGFQEKNLAVNNGIINYSDNNVDVINGITRGSYRVLITLYSGTLELLTWREIVVLSSDLVSSTERKLDSLNLYKITYELNDDENIKANFTDYALETYNRHSVVRILPQVTRQYYTFKGWHLKEDLSDQVITELPSSVNGDVSVYAEWNPITYQINYEFNGGDNDNVTFVDYTPETNTFSLPDTKKAGYKFCGWYETLDFSGDPVSQIKKGSGGNKTLYAKWCLADISIIYELNDNEEYPASFVGEKLDKYNYETEARTLPMLSRPCYDFEGWHLKADLSDESITSLPNIDSDEVKVYSKWKLHDFCITYNLNNGKFNDLTPISTFTIESETFALEVPYRPGYEFSGWYEKNDFSGNEITQIFKGTNSDIFLYAKWTALEISINYYLDGGEFITDAPITYKESLDCSYIVPYKKGQTFIGWYDSFEGTKKISILNDEKNILCARWANPSIGDIVLNDGRLIKVSSFKNTKMKVVAVLFYIEEDYCLGLGIYNSGDTKYKWCISNAKCYNRNNGIQTNLSGQYVNGPVTSIQGEFADGWDNWQNICEYDSNAISNSALYYPAFNYANTYTGNNDSDLYQAGWFLPSGAALLKVHENITEINSILEELDGDKIQDEYYWSSDSHKTVCCQANSSQQKSNSAFAYNMITGRGSGGWDGGGQSYVVKDQEFRVCAIRRFSW